MRSERRVARWAVIALVMAVGSARAQEATPERPRTAAGVQGEGDVDAEPVKPWSRGVPVARREAARALFLEGNRYLDVPLFAQAAEKYQEALALWPHPAFHFNLALAQLNLVQPVEAYESFGRAMAYAPDGIAADKHRLAEEYRQRLERQLARVEVACEQPGAEVTLDGKPLFVGPGRFSGVLVPGEHQLVAGKSGFLTETRRIALSAGERTDVALVLRRPTRTVTERYMPAWIPWASLGLSAAVLGVGVYYDGVASDTWASFDDYVDGRCPAGCTDIEAPELAPRHAQATRDTRTAQGFLAAGGVVLVGSAVLLYVNRERVVRRAVEDSISILPVMGPEGVGLAAQGHF